MLALALLAVAADPAPIPLWDNGPPGFEARKAEPETRDKQNPKTGEYRVTNVHAPYLTAFLPPPDKATGVGVVICPGGGHRELWVMHEGEFVARWLAERGVAAFVLRYRLAREKDSPYKLDVHPRQDGTRALRLVRSRAAEWKLDPAKVGVMGFSAGGETVGVTVQPPAGPQPDAADPVDRLSAVPAFQAHVYSGPLGVKGAAVTKDTPPAFLLVGDQDGAAAVLVEYFQALRAAKVPAELHVYAKAPHGFGYRPGAKRPVDQWPQRFLDWLGTIGLVK